MFKILETKERLTAINSDKDSIEFLIEEAVESLLPHNKKRRPIIKQPIVGQGSIQVVSKLKAGYEDADVLQSLRDYIFQLKLELQQPKLQENNQVARKIALKTPIGNKPTKSSLAKIKTQELQITQKRLIELLKEEYDDEYGILKPTPYAFNKAWNLIMAASLLMKNSFPKASVSTDSEGGIRLRWQKLIPEREVRLYCPSEPGKKIYIYHEAGDEYDAVYDISGETLAHWLNWLIR